MPVLACPRRTRSGPSTDSTGQRTGPLQLTSPLPRKTKIKAGTQPTGPALRHATQRRGGAPPDAATRPATVNGVAANGAAASGVPGNGIAVNGAAGNGPTAARDQHRAPAGSGRTERTSGSGLGLSIVQAIANAHGGRATLESLPGQGTKVRVWLPVRIVP